MKKIILGLLALGLLGGGGFGGYMYLNKPDATIEEAVQAKIENDHDTHKESSNVYVELEPVYVPVVNKNGIRKMVSLVIAIEVKDLNDASHTRAMKPKLVSYILQDMYGVFGRQTSIGSRQIKASMIKERLHRVSTRVLGDDIVQGVRLQAVTQRRV